VPELPEVETTRRALADMLTGAVVARVRVHERRLRLPIAHDLGRRLRKARFTGVRRRAKYLLLDTDAGSLIVHLGMSGSIRVCPMNEPRKIHDHVEITLADHRVLRYHDPRRFGMLVFTRRDPLRHPLLAGLGPEPLGPEFGCDRLYTFARGRRIAVKSFIMDPKVVVGIGNIYASEALFDAGIDPARAAGRISRARYRRLAASIRAVLEEAIAAGGTTLRDYVGGTGEPGYFRQRLRVYGRSGEPCPRCATPLRRRVIGQRASYYCPRCQR